jgi:prevent-host-death family protein
MERIIGAFEARRNFGRILQDVVTKGNKIIVERHGEPVAVVVPIEVYKQWQTGRKAFFDKLREVSERVGMSEEEATGLVDEAVRAIRSENDK